MRKCIVFAICGCLCHLVAIAQDTGFAGILQEVENKNPELRAIALHINAQGLEMRSENNLPAPTFGAYYLPFGDHSPGDYSEFEVNMSFDFPSVYRVRGQLMDRQEQIRQMEYRKRRQEILVEAQGLCLRIVRQNRRLETGRVRTERARTVLDQVSELYRQEEAGVLELNKAKVAWLEEQFQVRQLETERENLILMLRNLNGGGAVELNSDSYGATLELPSLAGIWQEKIEKDPALLQLSQRGALAEMQVKLAQRSGLPGLTAGLNRQGVAGAYYSGIYAGTTIPLWSNRHKVEAARSRLEFQTSWSDVQTMAARAGLERQYNDYQSLLAKYREYVTTLSALNSEELLGQAYGSGELSFIEYHLELRFYYQAYDAMLEMEYQLHHLQSTLLAHRL